MFGYAGSIGQLGVTSAAEIPPPTPLTPEQQAAAVSQRNARTLKWGLGFAVALGTPVLLAIFARGTTRKVAVSALGGLVGMAVAVGTSGEGLSGGASNSSLPFGLSPLDLGGFALGAGAGYFVSRSWK